MAREYTLPIILLDILLSSGWYSNKRFNERHINMEERDNDEEGKIVTQLSRSPGLSMSRVCYQRTNKEFEVSHDFEEAEKQLELVSKRGGECIYRPSLEIMH